MKKQFNILDYENMMFTDYEIKKIKKNIKKEIKNEINRKIKIRSRGFQTLKTS
jgi:hypothetical protein